MYASMFSLEIYCNTQNELAHPRRIVLIFYICGLCPYTEELIFSVISLGSIFGAINCCTNLQYQQTLRLRIDSMRAGGPHYYYGHCHAI